MQKQITPFNQHNIPALICFTVTVLTLEVTILTWRKKKSLKKKLRNQKFIFLPHHCKIWIGVNTFGFFFLSIFDRNVLFFIATLIWWCVCMRIFPLAQQLHTHWKTTLRPNPHACHPSLKATYLSDLYASACIYFSTRFFPPLLKSHDDLLPCKWL